MGFIPPKIPEAPWDALRVQTLRRLLGFTEEEMARHLHVRPRTLQLWESGRAVVTEYAIPMLEKLEKRTGQAEVKRISKMDGGGNPPAGGRAPTQADSGAGSRRSRGQLLLVPEGWSAERTRRTRQKLLVEMLALKRKPTVGRKPNRAQQTRQKLLAEMLASKRKSVAA